MDCSLSTWPSITQFDDFSWAGLGDIDPLESLDQSLDNEAGSSLPDSQELKPPASASAVPCIDTPAHIPHTLPSALCRLTSSESFIAARWDSISSVDLASVLDSSFPPDGDTSTPSAEDVYDLYTDNVLNDVDTLMSNTASEVDKDSTSFYPGNDASMDDNLISPELASLPCPLEDAGCGNGAVEDELPRLVKKSIWQLSTSKPMDTRRDCRALNVEAFDNGNGVSTDMVQSFPFHSAKPSVSGDGCTSSQCVIDTKESMFPLGPSFMMPWSKPQFTSTNHGVLETVMHPSALSYGDNYPAIIDQQVMMADAASVELKRNRAQASRARRLAANQRRVKKYPLQKLIRMSSASTSTRERLEQNGVGSVPTMHQPAHMVLPSQCSGSVQSLSRNTQNNQTASFVPVIQSPRAKSNMEVLSQPPSLQGGMRCSYQQTLTSLVEDKQGSSGSGAMQSMCTDQDTQSLSSAVTPDFSHSTNSLHGLDAALLEQLQTILSKMNVKVRICIRDALYRLANSAKLRQSRSDTASDSSSSISEAMETNTNSLDRWIVNILFYKQPTFFESNPELLPVDLGLSPNQPMQSLSTCNFSQPWNSCGSSSNLQEQPLHILTGL